MKRLMFINVQTSGIQKNYNIPVSDYENWTRLVSVSWYLNNEYLDSWATENHKIIRPIGFSINHETEDFNQISFEKAVNEGKPLIEVLKEIKKASEIVDFYVGHNIEFHLNVLRSELFRCGLGDIKNYNKTICLMKHGTSYCKIPSPNGYKYPSLNELYVCLFNEKIKYSYGSKHITNFMAIKNCYKKLFETNCFSKYGFKPDPIIKLLKIPFKEDGFPNKTFIQIKNKDNGKIDAYIDNILVYNDFDEVQKTDNWGLYLFKKKNEESIEYHLTDYRGVEILRTIDRTINYGFCPSDDNPEVVVNGSLFCNVAFYKGGLFLHNYSYDHFVYSLVSDDYFYLSNYEDPKVTIIDFNTGKILFRDEEITFKENTNKFIKCFINKFEVYNSKAIKIDTVNIKGEIIDFTENGKYLYFENDNKIGIMDLSGNVLISNKFDYLNFIEDSEHFYEFRINENDGIVNINNEVIFDPKYKFDVNYEQSFFHIINNSETKPKHGLISNLGEIVVPIENDELILHINEEDSFYEIKKSEYRNGIFLIKNSVLIEPDYNEVELRQNYIFVIKNDLEGIYDYNGNEILKCNYVFGRDYSWTELRLIVLKKATGNVLYSLLDHKIILKNFDDVKRLLGLQKDGYYAVIKNKLLKFISFNDKRETNYLYESWFANPSINFRFDVFKNNRLLVIKDGLFGFIDDSFEEIIPCKYNFATPFIGGQSKVKFEEDEFSIDINGDKITDF